MNIKVKLPSGEQLECRAVIAIPQVALSDATYIRTFTTGSPVRSKHEFHTLAQIALIQFDDDEIQLQEIIGEINLIAGKEIFTLTSGVVICRHESEELVIYITEGQTPRKYLEIANRYCTRWVRLDI